VYGWQVVSSNPYSCPLCPRKQTFASLIRMSALCQKRTSFNQRVDAISWGAVVKDRHEDVARFRRRVGAVGRDLAGDAAAIFRDNFSERIALNGDPLSGFDLVIELDQQLNEPAAGRRAQGERCFRQRDLCPCQCVPSVRR
jgi:hypothetical protein